MRSITRTTIAVALLGVAVAGAFLLPPRREVHQTVTPAAGTGEHLVLVVADIVSSAHVSSRLAELNASFGDLQGFYADASDAYAITGALVRSSADEVRLRCADHPEYDCPRAARDVAVQRAVKHRYVARTAFREHAFPPDCGRTARPPCERRRFVDLFGSDLRMPAGRTVIATAFRTRDGAAQFVAFARTLGIRGLVAIQAHKSGGDDVGLGQETHPGGNGPLTHELPDQAERQRA